MKRDYLAWAALLFALVATASAEYSLARAVGFNAWVAAAVPGALDVYTVRALRARKDVLAVVVAMIAVNAASHLVAAGLLPVSWPLVVAVSAIAPLVLWRVHRLADHAPAEVTTEVTAPMTVERADDEKGYASVPTLGEPLEVVTPPVIELPAVSPVWDDFTTSKVTAVPWFEDHTRAPLKVKRTEYALDHERRRWVPVDDAPVTAAVPAETDRQVVTEPVSLSPSELRRKARQLHRQVVRSGGRGVTIDQLRAEFGLSRRDATELRREVVTEVAS